jgi:hypothetical protein
MSQNQREGLAEPREAALWASKEIGGAVDTFGCAQPVDN